MTRQTLWTLAEIAHALNVSPAVDAEVSGVSIDSRTLQPGDLFVALAGTPSGGFTSSYATERDGHDYVADAARRGASAAIVRDRIAGVAIPQFVVEDTLISGLWALARAARARASATVIAVTGSAGKTTTKEMLAAGLGAHASPGSYNNMWGVPLTLARLAQDAPWAVIEIGMNQPGEIARLSSLVRPDVAIVLNVAPVHLANLGSVDAIRREKLSIAEGLGSDGTLVLPVNLEVSAEQWAGRTVRFGVGGEVEAIDIRGDSDRAEIAVQVEERRVSMSLFMPSPHRIDNALAALAAAWAGGADPEVVAARLRDVGVVEGRGNAVTIGDVTVIDDSFNANPASMHAAIASLRLRTATRRIAIIGDMLELGDAAEQYHRALATNLGDIDKVICVGSLMRYLYDELPVEQQYGYYPGTDAIELPNLVNALRAGDVVLVKGSKRVFWVGGFVGRLVELLKRRAEAKE